MRWGYLAATWCLLFAILHGYWGLGGSAGLASSAGAELAAARPTAFVLFGLWGVAIVLIAGAAFGLGLVRWRLTGRWHSVVRALGLIGAAVLLLRGVLVEVVLLFDLGGVASAVGPLRTGWSLLLWNPWFVLGGLLFLLAAVQFGARRPGSVRSVRDSC